MSAATWSARSKPASPKMIRAMPRRSQIMSATTSAIAPEWPLTFSSLTKLPWLRRSFSPPMPLSERDFQALYGALAGAFAMKLIIFALILRAVGVFSSILGIMAVKAPVGRNGDPMKPINRGYYTSAIASVIGFFIVNYFYMTDPAHWATGLAFRHHRDARHRAGGNDALADQLFHPSGSWPGYRDRERRRAPARRRLIISGLGEGLESSVWAADADRPRDSSVRWSSSATRSRCSSMASRLPVWDF